MIKRLAIIFCLFATALLATQSVKTVNGLAIASVKTMDQLAIASVKTVNGLDNTSSSFAPTDIAGLKLWLKADGSVYNTGTTQATDGQTVETWVDSAAVAGNPTESTNKPTFQTNEINSLPVIRFGSSDKLLLANFDDNFTTAATCFVLVKIPGGVSSTWFCTAPAGGGGHVDAFSNGYGYLSTFQASGRLSAYDYVASNTWTIATITADTHFIRRLNGVAGSTQSITFGFGDTTLSLGKNPTAYPGNCDIAEVIVYDSVLSAGDITDVEAYLTNKYGL